MAPFTPPPQGPGVQFGNGEDQALPYTGLAGLAQGFTQGLNLGHQYQNQAETMQMHKDQMANEAAWREAQAKQMSDYHQGTIDVRNRALDEKPTFAPAGMPIQTQGPDGKPIMALTDGHGGIKFPPQAKGATKDADKTLNAAAGAYKAMDDYQDIANKFLPESSFGGAAMAIPEMFHSAISQTSPENNLKDKSGQAATFYAAAVNAGGGGRMSEAEIQNMAHAMGGKGIGETKGNIGEKISKMKEELAARTGLSRQQIEDYMAKTSGGNPGRVTVISPNGQVGHIPANQLNDALKQGYRQQ